MRPLGANSFLTGASHPPLIALEEAVRFTFTDGTLIEEARRTLELALIAVESLYGVTVVALDADYRFDRDARSVAINLSSAVGRALATVYHGYVLAEFGSDAVTIERVRRGQRCVGGRDA